MVHLPCGWWYRGQDGHAFQEEFKHPGQRYAVQRKRKMDGSIGEAYLMARPLSVELFLDQIGRFTFPAMPFAFETSVLPFSFFFLFSSFSLNMCGFPWVSPLWAFSYFLRPGFTLSESVVLVWSLGMTGPTLVGAGICMIATSSGDDHRCPKHYGG
ncbi:hypothetical protein BDV59DRAFT_183773, partial [Aspergillus ambiguus]|uniref:uncharacterized protein n=1 Tax=Aspergillus ambiguus TaxID=176160 RepID=UPI003CCD9E73